MADPITCPVCQGRGEFYAGMQYGTDPIFERCARCDGVGWCTPDTAAEHWQAVGEKMQLVWVEILKALGVR